MQLEEAKIGGWKSAAPTTHFLLAIILLFAAGLRIYQIGKASLWTDELSSLQFSCGREAGSFGGTFDRVNTPGVNTTALAEARSWSDTWYASATDTHPPLHAVALRAWRTVFGESDVAARCLSAFCSLLAILALFDSVRSLHSATAALFAAAIMAVASPQIVNAQEARGYAMVLLLTLTITAILLRIETRGTNNRRRIALFLFTACALLTHYAAMPFTLALIVYACLRLRGRSLWTSLFSFACAAIIFWALWGSIFVLQQPAMRANLTWLADDGPGFFVRWLQRLATLPLRLFITPKKSDAESMSGLIPAIFYLAPLLLIRERKLLIWMLVGGASIGAVAVSDALQQRRSLDWERYTLVAGPALYALVAALPTLKHRKESRDATGGNARRSFNLLWLVPSVFVLGCALSLEEAYSRYWKADYRGYVRELDSLASADDLLITNASTREDWKNAILLAAITHYSAHPDRPTLIVTKPSVGIDRDAIFISTQSDLAVTQWLKDAHVVQQRTVPFVGSIFRIRIDRDSNVTR